MPNLLIIEPHCSGHRAGYVSWIAKGAVERGFHVQLVTLSSSACHPLWLELQEVTGSMLQMITLQKEPSFRGATSTAGLIRKEFAYWRLLNRSFKQCMRAFSTDFVIVPYLDYCASAVAILGSPFLDTPWCGIVMRQSFHHDSMGVVSARSLLLPLKKHSFLRLLNNKYLRKLFSIDETLVAYIGRDYAEVSGQLSLLADPASLSGQMSQEEARRLLEIPLDCHVILVYGCVDSRKGVDALISAMVDRAAPENIHLLIAGVQGDGSCVSRDNPKFRPLFDAGRIHTLAKFLDDREELVVFKAASIVWLGYRGHVGMSGVLVQAGQMKLPVIACREGLIGWITKTNKSGVVVDIDNPASVLKGINDLVRDPGFAELCGKNGSRKFAEHTPGKFIEPIIRALN